MFGTIEAILAAICRVEGDEEYGRLSLGCGEHERCPR